MEGVEGGSGGRGFAVCFLGLGVTVVEERGREGKRETGFELGETDMEDGGGGSSFGRERDRDLVRKL